MAKISKDHHVYYDFNIFRTSPSSNFRWSTCINGRFSFADTLDGMKRMIRKAINKQED